ncbi:MAG: LysM peptidoglycan-binding domain-containing protein [Anaerolineae bacterium]|nr:LysM peptidoglycan-binding domain-containing protein [Anaerolineae bacterium]
MQLRRALPFVFVLLAATACFRPADDSFDTVDSEGAQIIPSETPLAAVTVISPGSEPAGQAEEATEEIIVQAEASNTPVPTQLRIIESTNTPQPIPTTDEGSALTVPTATQPSIITPQAPPNQQPIVTATQNAESTAEVIEGAGLQATPTDLASTTGDCEYIVQSGDNAFRIALNNNVSLDDLLSVNGLPAEPILQVGQVLVIPGCTAEEEVLVPTSEPNTNEESVRTPGDEIIHVVTSGETLLTIARQYGVTVNDIVNANDLPNPNVLDVGQELIIPQVAEDE